MAKKYSSFIWELVFLLILVSLPAEALNDLNQEYPVISGAKICADPLRPCIVEHPAFGTGWYAGWQLTFSPITCDAPDMKYSPVFYAVILNSSESPVNENGRNEIQKLFPGRKVFKSDNAHQDPIFYTNVNNKVNFVAVYAGKTQKEGSDLLAQIKLRYGKRFPDANLRKMQVGWMCSSGD